MCSCEFCKIFKNIFFTEHLWTTASGYSRILFHGYLCIILRRCWKPGCLFDVPEIFISGQWQNMTVIGFVSNTSSALLPYTQVSSFSRILSTELRPIFSCDVKSTNLWFYFTKKIFNCGWYLTPLMSLLRFLWSLVKFPWR